MATTLMKLWRRLFPFRCEWCEFTSRTPQGMGKHRKRCAVHWMWNGEVFVRRPKDEVGP